MKIYTIGYSGKCFDEIIKLLKINNVEVLIDVRRWPKSKYLEFCKEFLEKELPKYGVDYVHIEELGGFRKGGYENYIRTGEFEKGIEKLLRIARDKICCVMCREKLTKYCHRRFIIDYLKSMGVYVENL